MNRNVLVAAILVAMAGTARAQSGVENAPAEKKVSELDAVVVQGYRESLRKALAVKRDEDQIVEAIALDDMGKLPDKSMADALKQLPGLTATLDRGNASQIIVRGMGPVLSFTTLDGRELASNETDRSVKLEQFPAELMSGAEVFKTQSARMVEGGIAGTIDLKTLAPLDIEGRRIKLSTTLAYYPQASSISDSDAMYPGVDTRHESFDRSLSTSLFGGDTPFGTKASFGYIDQFFDRTLGLALGVGYQDQQSTYKGVAGWTYEGAPTNDQGDRTPWGFQSYKGGGREQRNSAMVKLQWRPVEEATISYDFYYAKKDFNEFDTERWVDAWEADRYTDPVARDGYVVGGTVVPNSLWNVNANYVQEEDVRLNAVNGLFHLGDWKLTLDMSKSAAKSFSAWYALQNTMVNAPVVTWDFDASEPRFAIEGDDPDALESYNPGTRLAVSPYSHLRDDLAAFSADLWRPVDWGPFAELSFGVRSTDREKSYSRISWKARCGDAISLDSFTEGSRACGTDAFDPNGREQSVADLTAGWRVREDTTSSFAQLGINTEWAGVPVRGNLGVRYVSTHSRSDGVRATSWADASTGWEDVTTVVPVLVRDGYDEVLPSLNLIFSVSDERQWRFAAAKAMSRAPVDDMRAAGALSRDWSANDEALTGTAGNPWLRPFLATQVDLYHDWYFNEDSLFSTGVFYKDVDTYIGLTTRQETIDGRRATITYPENGKGGYIAGAEIAYQNPFELPNDLGTLGLFANYSYVKSNIEDFLPVDDPVGLNGLTKHNFNSNIWYSKAGYEIRLGYSYHSDYTYAVTADPTGTVKARSWVNLGVSKSFGNNEIKLQVDNLTNAKLENYVQRQTFNWGKFQEFGRRVMLTWSYAFDAEK